MNLMLSAALFFIALVAGPAEAREAPDAEQAEACCTVSITAVVPDGTGPVYLTGNLPDLGPWAADALTMRGDARERSAHLQIPRGTAFEYKFTLGSWEREALGPSGMVMANHRLIVDGDTDVQHEIFDFKKETSAYVADWQGSGVKGTLIYWTDVASTFLEPTRHVSIWLPPGYEDHPDTHYPVLYMHDGQNLFDPRIANTGVDWGVDEAIVSLVETGAIPPVIVVAAWNTADRAREYSPWHGAPDYARFLIEELMPRVNAAFRTQTEPDHTAVMGSSMGGLLSFYLVTNHPDVFGACGCVSTHFPLSEAMAVRYMGFERATANPNEEPYILGDIDAGLMVPDGVRYWFDYGTLGLDAAYGPTHQAVRDWLLAQNLTEGEDFVVRVYDGADHNEASWRARLADPLVFLFGGSN